MSVGSMSTLPKVFTDHGDTGTHWIGEDGDWIYVSRGQINSNNKSLLSTRLSSNDFRFRKERNHMRDFLDCVKSRRETIAPVEAGHRSASIGHLSTIACIMGETLEWNPKREQFKNNEIANRMLSRPNRGEWATA
jgi:hypothetical protein